MLLSQKLALIPSPLKHDPIANSKRLALFAWTVDKGSKEKVVWIVLIVQEHSHLWSPVKRKTRERCMANVALSSGDQLLDWEKRTNNANPLHFLNTRTSCLFAFVAAIRHPALEAIKRALRLVATPAISTKKDVVIHLTRSRRRSEV